MVAALAAATLAALALTGAPDAVARDRCTARGAKTVVASGASRVFSVAIKRGREYFGCRKGQRPVLLTRDFSPADAEETATTTAMFRVSGSAVAWLEKQYSDFGVGEFGQGIVVRSLRPGGRKLEVDVPDTYGLAALAVRADGAVAWILSTDGAFSPGRPSSYAEVGKLDSKAKRPVALAYARNIDFASLRVDDESVDWLQAGSSMSAPLR